MKPKPYLPGVVSAVIGIAAVALFLHTRASRSASAEVLQASRAAMARDLFRQAENGSAGSAHGWVAGTPVHGKDLQKRMDQALKISNTFDQTRALLVLVKGFTADDFAVALDACPEMAEGFRSDEFMRIFREWVRRDPRAALAYAGQDTKLKTEALEKWAGTDIQAAMDWAREEGRKDPAKSSLGAVMNILARRDPQAAIACLGELNPRDLNRVIFIIGEKGDGATAEAILQWAENSGDRALPVTAATAVFQAWNADRPQKQRFDILRDYPEVIAGVDLWTPFAAYCREDPAAARDALELVPPGQSRATAVDSVLRELINGENVDAVLELMDAYPGSATQERAAEGISQLTYKNPLRALERLSLIHDPELRQDTHGKVLANWVEKDAPSAAEWLQNHEISDGVKAKMDEHIGIGKKVWERYYESEKAKASVR